MKVTGSGADSPFAGDGGGSNRPGSREEKAFFREIEWWDGMVGCFL